MTTRLVGLISDTHGLLRPAAIGAFQGVERIIHAGDIDTPGVLQALRALAPVTAVRGNVDRGSWASDLPTTAALTIEQVSVYVLHSLSDLDLVPEAAGFRVVVSGHSHRPAIRERNGVLYVNPGSAGPRRFRAPVSAALLEVQDALVEVRLVPLGG
jgi:putative phosphoesterase